MSIPTLLRALAQGYTASEIIKWLQGGSKSLAKQLKSALKQGYTDDQILTYLTKGKYASHGERNQMLSGMTEEEKGARITNRPTNWKGIAKGASLAAATVPAAMALGKAFPEAAQGIRNIFGEKPPAEPNPIDITPKNTSPQPPIGPSPMANAPIKPPSTSPFSREALSQEMRPQAPITPQTSNGLAQTAPSPTANPAKTRASEFFRNLGVESRVEELARQGKNPEEIASDIQFDMNPQTRKAYLAKRTRGEEIPIAQHVKEFLTDQNGFLREGILKSEEKAAPLKKGQTVVDIKSGITGDLHDIKQKDALVNDDGKLHKVSVENLVSSPLPEKDLAELYDDLVKGIEKETGTDVSRNVNWAGYDPDHNELVYLPHDGSLYTYDDISEEDKKELTNILNVRASTGGNFIGAWEAGSASPIGAAMSKLIQKLQKERGGKGKEYSRKYATVYSALEPAIKASKLAFKKRKK